MTYAASPIFFKGLIFIPCYFFSRLHTVLPEISSPIAFRSSSWFFRMTSPDQLPSSRAVGLVLNLSKILEAAVEEATASIHAIPTPCPSSQSPTPRSPTKLAQVKRGSRYSKPLILSYKTSKPNQIVPIILSFLTRN